MGIHSLHSAYQKNRKVYVSTLHSTRIGMFREAFEALSRRSPGFEALSRRSPGLYRGALQVLSGALAHSPSVPASAQNV